MDKVTRTTIRSDRATIGMRRHKPIVRGSSVATMRAIASTPETVEETTRLQFGTRSFDVNSTIIRSAANIGGGEPMLVVSYPIKPRRRHENCSIIFLLSRTA